MHDTNLQHSTNAQASAHHWGMAVNLVKEHYNNNCAAVRLCANLWANASVRSNPLGTTKSQHANPSILALLHSLCRGDVTTQ